jgi:putative ABC transport system permease protein
VLRIAIKDLFARKRRLVTTGIAVVLGIAFLTGTQLLSVTLSDSIKSLVGDIYSNFDAVVRSPNTQDTPFGTPIRTLTPAALVPQVQAVPGVSSAAGIVESTGPELVGADGKVIGGGFGPPTLTYNWIDDAALQFGTLNSGRAPQAAFSRASAQVRASGARDAPMDNPYHAAAPGDCDLEDPVWTGAPTRMGRADRTFGRKWALRGWSGSCETFLRTPLARRSAP